MKIASEGVIADLPSTGYVRQSRLIPSIIPFSAATLWRKVKTGEFPKPVKLSERVTAWDVRDVRAWLDSRRDQGQADRAAVEA
jgi:predicted DNA-binding transcriptional regulator AlpA